VIIEDHISTRGVLFSLVKGLLTREINGYLTHTFNKYPIYLVFKASVTPNGDAKAFVQRSKTMSARCGIAAENT